MLTLTLPADMADSLAQIATELASDTRPWRTALGLELQGALFRASVHAVRTAAPGATPPAAPGATPPPAKRRRRTAAPTGILKPDPETDMGVIRTVGAATNTPVAEPQDAATAPPASPPAASDPLRIAARALSATPPRAPADPLRRPRDPTPGALALLAGLSLLALPITGPLGLAVTFPLALLAVLSALDR